MIRFEPPPTPANFFERVERRGKEWLLKNSAKRPADYWSEFKPDLAEGFRNLCAYSAIYEPVGTVDHFVSCDQDRSRAYDWSNYRFAAQWINASKQNLRSTEILDPFDVRDEWFEILLPSLQLVLTASVPEQLRAAAETMLKRLHLGHDERVVRQRREWYRMYQAREITLEGLAKKAPLLAAAVRKQDAPDSSFKS